MGTLQTQGKMIEGFSVHHLSSTTIYTLQSNPLVYIFLVTSSFSLLLEISYERSIKVLAKNVLLLNSADCFQRGSILSADHDRQPNY